MGLRPNMELLLWKFRYVLYDVGTLLVYEILLELSLSTLWK
ncbi:hypothetical protein C8J38_1292 [Rhizobium sp. PP-WC-2G-219]|nr:hypothetical protein C8J38_1292 [Rhizobium sp. PP-WC-2G-219]